MIGGGVLEPAINERLAAMNGEVVNVGFVNQSKLPLYYAAMDVFVSTSRIDPHPLVISEAMAAGCPAILSDRCGNWGYSDILQHRYNGLVYSCGNVSALAESMLALADDDTRKLYSQHAREVTSGQDINCSVRAFIEIIGKIKGKTSQETMDVENILSQKSASTLL
jgi:glycosyltransferase involved in cell wall biosynthesis